MTDEMKYREAKKAENREEEKKKIERRGGEVEPMPKQPNIHEGPTKGPDQAKQTNHNSSPMQAKQSLVLSNCHSI